MKGEKPLQGLRLNGGKKQQILRAFTDDGTNGFCIYGKITRGGCCISAAGKCILIATFDEGQGHTSVGCNEVVQLMAKYLVKSIWPANASEQEGDKSDMSAAVNNADTWKPYVNDMLIGRGSIAQAMICSKEDLKVWASSSDFKLCVYEAEIPQEDGTDKKERVDEARNLLQVRENSIVRCNV